MIVKVLMPRTRDHAVNHVLVFTEHEELILTYPLRSRFWKDLWKSRRGYYYADYDNGHLQILEKAPTQNW